MGDRAVGLGALGPASPGPGTKSNWLLGSRTGEMMMYRGKMRNLAVFLSVLFLIPVFSIAQVAFVKDFNAALKQAAREKKFIVLDISASW
jgi:hypothetical protein